MSNAACQRDKETVVKCESCNSNTLLRKVRKQHWFKGRLYIIQNVEAEVCEECGERYFHASTLDKIDEMISGEHDVMEVLSVEVLSA